MVVLGFKKSTSILFSQVFKIICRRVKLILVVLCNLIQLSAHSELKAKSLSLETDDTETEEDILDKYPWISDN